MPSINGSAVKKVIVACDAGMGSSVMVASNLKSRLKQYGVEVDHIPVNQLPEEPGLVVLCHQGLAPRAQQTAPHAVVVPFAIFMGDPAFAALEKAIADGEPLES
ncbi:PTS lactose transporter subunit IIB [Demequina salsinemoris]|uniref:PTS lactose transporter subunit IIB n=1 Tax=Demequina salsinemoris TaxID=577470 RepID=UPI00078389FC|nr:PTS lactose transporter subunit IIB [Demequina salsinemoris]